MIRIREKDILFIAINLVMFFGFFSAFFMSWAMSFLAAPSASYPTVQEGYAYVCYVASTTLITIAGLITFFVDCWWIYRFIRELQDGYWKENL